MFGSSHPHDAFKCPNSGQEWHNHLLNLRKELETLHSNKLKELVQQEIEEVMKANHG
jgi:hypothetical protein